MMLEYNATGRLQVRLLAAILYCSFGIGQLDIVVDALAVEIHGNAGPADEMAVTIKSR